MITFGANSGIRINTGWWCCINKNGRRGIVPANRLRMLHRFDQNTSPQESISSQPFIDSNSSSGNSNRRRFMFGNTGRLSTTPFIDDNDSLNDITSSLTNEFINLPTFNSGSLFDRIFPLSPLERYKDTSLRHMSNGTFGSPPYGVVRNIPIKVESASLNDNGNSFDKIRSNTLVFSSNRNYNDDRSSSTFPYYYKKFERLASFSKFNHID
ncbi:unnamed protein product [Acanthocheilonema viteae]|uniref:SH3 domain-containing protein n=1 Tax=Acanthocheilonema viteae TaxID=6277 RepID=A0A498SHN0_ACAVI|nr:unnamed protein product [Acanthocheilonema viteae]